MIRGLLTCIIFLFAAVATITGLAAKPVEATVREHQFTCRGGEQLRVNEREGGAAVQLGKSTYDLRSRTSSLGRKFASSQATLIIDGRFAVFVATDRINLRECYARAT